MSLLRTCKLMFEPFYTASATATRLEGHDLSHSRVRRVRIGSLNKFFVRENNISMDLTVARDEDKYKS